MREPDGRNPSSRDLHHLSTADLIALIQADIQDLDRLIKSRPPREQEQKGRSRKAGGRRQVTLDELRVEPDEEPERLALHTVSCCNHAMGAFTASARVRCPFCGVWHRAGDFPQADLR